MNFSTAVAEVLAITKRPDKAVSAAQAVNKALSFCTLKGDFPRDTVEASIAIDATLYGDTISISSLANFRRFLYVKPAGFLYYLNRLEGDKIFTPKNAMQKDVYYTAGSNMTYTLSSLASSLEVSYLTYPSTLSGTDTHWMLDMIPYAITDLAAARIFAEIGDDQSAGQYERSGMDLFLTMRRDLNQER